MHTFEWPHEGSPEDCPEKKVIIHADGSPRGGPAIIRAPDGAEIKIEADALFAFVANAIRDERIGALEDASTEEILGIVDYSRKDA